MISTKNINQYLHLHFIVLLLGFTAILGALIKLPATELVWFRMLMAFGGLWMILFVLRIPLKLSPPEILRLLGIGVIVALHWITFFHAIKVSNVSVTLGVFASVTFFTSILEPLMQKRRIFWLELLLGMVTILGIYIIFRFEFRFTEGIIFSLVSALLNALFAVFNRNISKRYHPGVISFYEMFGGFAFLSLFFLVTGQFDQGFALPSGTDLIFLLILSLICTSYAFMAIVHILKSLSAYTVMLAINLEPVYGIILAWLIFPKTEQMTPGFYLGAAVLVSAVLAYPILKRKFLKES